MPFSFRYLVRNWAGSSGTLRVTYNKTAGKSTRGFRLGDCFKTLTGPQRKDMTTLKRVSLSLALLAVFSTAMMAQVTAGTILGNVRDASGAAVGDTAISIKEINKGTVQTYKTDENGGFYAPFLTPGTYQVTV